jgi:hypothetical protein
MLDKIRLTLAIASLDVALHKANWNADGSVKKEAVVLKTLTGAAGLLEGSKLAVSGQFDPVLSVVRDVVQKRAVAKATSPKAAAAAAQTALAESDLLSRRPGAAAKKLVAAYDLLK